MQELAHRLAGFVDVGDDLAREFEMRLVESSTLAFRVAFSVLRHQEDAEDVAQEAFAKAYRNFRSLRDRGRFRAWLVRLTWRLALDRQRADRRRLFRENHHALSREGPDRATQPVDERARAIWEAIDALPPKYRVVIVLGAIEGYNVREVAQLLNLREGTVKSRLFGARRRLRERLG